MGSKTFGFLGGGAGGALLGTVLLPGIGTLAGAAIGTAVGGSAGYAAGSALKAGSKGGGGNPNSSLDPKVQNMLYAGQTVLGDYYQPEDYQAALNAAQQQMPNLLASQMQAVNAQGQDQMEKFLGMIPTALSSTQAASQQLQSQMTAAFRQQLQAIDPNYQQRLATTGSSADALAAQANKYLTGQDASQLITTATAQTKEAQGIASTMLSGKMSAADQLTMDKQTAATAGAFGQWGGANAGMLSGSLASQNLISSQNLQLAGITVAQQASGITGNAFNTLAGIGQVGQTAAAQQQALSAQYMGPQLDVSAMYNQTLGALSGIGTTNSASMLNAAQSLYGSTAQTLVAQQDSNLSQRDSLLSTGIGMQADVYGYNAQVSAAKSAANASMMGGAISGLGSLGGAAIIASALA